MYVGRCGVWLQTKTVDYGEWDMKLRFNQLMTHISQESDNKFNVKCM